MSTFNPHCCFNSQTAIAAGRAQLAAPPAADLEGWSCTDLCQGWGRLPGDVKVTSYLGYCGGRKGVCSRLLGSRGSETDVQRLRCARLQEGEGQQAGEDASSQLLLSMRVQGEKSKMASSAQSRQDWEKYVLGKGLTLTNPEKNKGQKLLFPSAGKQKHCK